jgi:hypothetical protein
LGACSPSKRDQDAVLGGLGAHGLGLEHDVVEARRVHLLPDAHQVAVGALHQAVEHFDHVQARAQRGIHRAHFEADDAAAQDQHALGHFLEASAPVESTTRGSTGMKGRRTACEPAAMMQFLKRDGLLLAGLLLAFAGGLLAPSGGWADEGAEPRTTVTLRILAIAARPPVSLPTTLSLCACAAC